jgi:hypothetical protein
MCVTGATRKRASFLSRGVRKAKTNLFFGVGKDVGVLGGHAPPFLLDLATPLLPGPDVLAQLVLLGARHFPIVIPPGGHLRLYNHA